MDVFYTPATMAEKMVSCFTGGDVISVADFSVGGGELLKAAQDKWPTAHFIGAEINGSTVRDLKENYPSWRIEELDFLTLSKSDESGPFLDLIGSITLILMNPPFSSRGFVRYSVELQGEVLRASHGLAFVITALRFLASNGQLIAVLPAGTLTSQKDRACWSKLREYYHVHTLQKNGNRSFKNCSPDTVLVRFSKKAKPRKNPAQIRMDAGRTITEKGIKKVRLFRGKLSVDAAQNGTSRTFPFVHSTNLIDGQVQTTGYRVRDSYASIVGPAVLLNRVGMPKVKKTVLFLSNDDIVISDCVIALLCERKKDAKLVRDAILDNWITFESLYNGTCAKFITLESLNMFLGSIGLDVSIGPRP